MVVDVVLHVVGDSHTAAEVGLEHFQLLSAHHSLPRQQTLVIATYPPDHLSTSLPSSTPHPLQGQSKHLQTQDIMVFFYLIRCFSQELVEIEKSAESVLGNELYNPQGVLLGSSKKVDC
jgi:hypothetical protein